MFGWLKSAFTSAPQNKAAQVQEEEEYKGYRIQFAPEPVGGQFRIAAHIQKVGDDTRTHHLIRADLLPDMDTAIVHTRLKARQAIDQLGDRLFN
ncbi:HlyU family transcriptional regulator [Salinispirillum marinum]|uniref:HlyU family transcriptional regulator n=2 Tax=Saccharospirillaceae TaxID=255527 RepID=A0ABV8BIR1_9GAMM